MLTSRVGLAFVPRAEATKLGHGVPHHAMAKNCFQDFKNVVDCGHCDPFISAHR